MVLKAKDQAMELETKGVDIEVEDVAMAEIMTVVMVVGKAQPKGVVTHLQMQPQINQQSLQVLNRPPKRLNLHSQPLG